MKPELNLGSARARQARAAALIGNTGASVLFWLALLLAAAAAGLFVSHSHRLDWLALAAALTCLMPALWYKRSIKKIPVKPQPQTLDDVIEQKLLASFGRKAPATASELWQAAIQQGPGRFICTHLLIYPDSLNDLFGAGAPSAVEIWQAAETLRQKVAAPRIDGGTLVAVLLLSPAAKDFLAKSNLTADDVLETFKWLNRLTRFLDEENPYFGGIGRDWAAGFTPYLDRFGENISHYVEAGQGHFHTLAHADILNSLVDSLTKQSGVALVGDPGTGKTSVVYALAERLLKGNDPSLQYYQIVKLNSSQIISAAGGQLEGLMLSLFAEAVHAHNIILFLDEAQLFFGQGTGAFDVGQVLMPVLQNRALKVITAWTPDDFQNLKTKNAALAKLFNSVAITPADPAATLSITEDSALTFEARESLLVSYQAVKEACRLSDQYMQDQAYPGKAINLLEQSLPFAQNKIVSAESVQLAVEKTRGVKVAKAEGPETDTLLHLEDKIHSRMINQERAVQVIAAALRRGRAGVSDPKRPIGSFLFLGPTGVGKTELARSLAAVYFGDERQMIRLDMSEYQQTEDIDRLLDSGGDTDRSLILKIREQPFAVVLLDEIEKAHPNILNLLLQLLDEGQLTDKGGKPASFRNAIVIATSNAGSAEISQRVAHGDQLENFERPLIDALIARGQFKAELINRFDEVVLFRPLNLQELSQVAVLMLEGVNKLLAKQNVTVKLTPNALAKVVQAGYDPEFGARPMRRVIQEMVEDAVATKILKNEAQPGSTLTLDTNDLISK